LGSFRKHAGLGKRNERAVKVTLSLCYFMPDAFFTASKGCWLFSGARAPDDKTCSLRPQLLFAKKTFQRHSSMVVRVSSWMLGGVFDLTMTSHSHERSKLLLCASLLRIVFCIYFTSLLPSIILSLVLVYAFVGLINKPISYLSVYSQLNSNMVMSEFNLLPMKFLETRARAYKNICT